MSETAVKKVDLSSLIDPRCFQQLPKSSEDVREKLHIPGAKKAEEELVRCNSDDSDKIFELWGDRIKCLLRANLVRVAREESRVFGDLSSDKYRDETTSSSIVPWDFRLMMVQVQGGAGAGAGGMDNRLPRLYSMAREARIEAHKSKDSKVWDQRLMDLGMFVGWVLVSMGDIPCAIDHYQSMYKSLNEDYKPNVALALGIVNVKIGDTIQAREWFSKCSKDVGGICAIADADWQSFSEDNQNNLAISKLYEGKFNEAVDILTELVEKEKDVQYVYNLFTVLDLEHEIGVEKKRKVMDTFQFSESA